MVFLALLLGSIYLNRGTLVYAPTRSELTLPQDTIAEPGALAPPRSRSVEATARLEHRGRGSLGVTVHGEPETLAGLYVTVLDEDSGAPLATLQLPAAGETGKRLEFRNLPLGKHTVLLVRAPATATWTYLLSTQVEVGRDESRNETSLYCRLRTLRVTFELAGDENIDEPAAGIPVILRRQGDPKWRYQEPGALARSPAPRITDEFGVVTFPALPEGSYILEPQDFEPAAEDRARLTFDLENFEADRPIKGRTR